jgi:hypothetical protein
MLPDENFEPNSFSKENYKWTKGKRDKINEANKEIGQVDAVLVAPTENWKVVLIKEIIKR